MIRTQIQLTESQAEGLKEIAALRGVSMAEIVREAVERIIQDNANHDKWTRARSAIGRYHTGPSDVSVRHDDYLDEDYSS